MTNKEDDAFGFFFVDEKEFTDYEDSLKEQITTQSSLVNKAQDKLDRVMKLMGPFLSALGSDQDKIYIKWPNRGAKVTEFVAKLTKIYNE